jgi:hypothetical protein
VFRHFGDNETKSSPGGHLLASTWCGRVEPSRPCSGAADDRGKALSVNDELRQELDVLRAELTALRAQFTPIDASGHRIRALSRRNLLRAAPVAALSAGIAALAAAPATASSGQPVLQGKVNNDGSGTTTLTGGTPYNFDNGGNSLPASPALAVNGGLTGDWATFQGIEIGGDQGAAFYCEAGFHQGYAAEFIGEALDAGNHATEGGPGVRISVTGPGTALLLDTQDGEFYNPSDPTGASNIIYPATGIQIGTRAGRAIEAQSGETVVSLASTDETATADALTVSYAGKSRALYAESTNAANINGTVTGVNDGAGIGVWGENKNTTAAGVGVVGVGNKAGRGGQFSGGAAQARFVPGTSSSHPTTGKAGDFYVDSAARLWFCQKASTTTTAATWKQIA